CFKVMRCMQTLRTGPVKRKRPPAAFLASLLLGSLVACSSLVSAATLSGRSDNLYGGTNDLTAEGTLDWGFWGWVTEWSYSHKYGVTPQIRYSFVTDFADWPNWDGPYLLDPRYGGTLEFSWTNGTPRRAMDDTWNGITIFGDKLLPGSIPSGFHLE